MRPLIMETLPKQFEKVLQQESIKSQTAEILQRLIGRVEVIPREADRKGVKLKISCRFEQALELLRPI
ncbi:hypothetical protein WH95_17535 [Kiloniella litopenaei]|uniref:Uncharacterized protein n=1 Tax=Kiloniella litopenaei TaxID=1549748 RepID=A0A0M2R6I1_9PROT|nr:hypothetical protein WH95_17535 [Kiloniella litopenaei]